MGAVLERIRAKVTRAKQHIQDFQLGLKAFHDTKPYAVGIKEDAHVGKRTYYVTKVDPVPHELTAIAADVLQNLRSTLDHIAYQLVLDARSGAAPDWSVYYPISGSAAAYPATRKGQIKGVREEIVDAIDATEPYKRGKGHTLWQLNELNKSDKHKLLIGAVPYAAGVDIIPTLRQAVKNMPRWVRRLSALMPPLFIREVGPLKPLDVGYELYIEPMEHKVDKNRQFRFDIAFDKPGIIDCEPALKTLQDMANLVDQIIIKLGRLLP